MGLPKRFASTAFLLTNEQNVSLTNRAVDRQSGTSVAY